MAPNKSPSKQKTIQAAKRQKVAFSKQTDSNDAKSPFLRLPAELRHRIYRYALRNKVIHVFGRIHQRDTTHHLAVCAHAPVDDRKDSRQHVFDRKQHPELDLSELELEDQGIDWVEPEIHPHNQCTLQPSNLRLHLHLQLLQVCRRIYNEACLTPFQENTFVTTAEFNERGLRDFLATLVPKQLKNVRHLVLVADDNTSLKYSHSSKLAGLRSLHLVLPDNLWDSGTDRPPAEYLKVARFNVLSKLKLKSVRVSYTFQDYGGRALLESVIEEIEELMAGRERDIAAGPDLYLARREVFKKVGFGKKASD